VPSPVPTRHPSPSRSVPDGYGPLLSAARREVLAIDGVLDIPAFHFWQQAASHNVCTAVLRVRADASEAAVLAAAQRVWGRLAADLTVQVEKEAVGAAEWQALAAGGGLGAGGSGSGSSRAGAPSLVQVHDSHGHSHSHGHGHGAGDHDDGHGHSHGGHGHSHGSGGGGHGHSHGGVACHGHAH
jgi:hypothetical protein